MTQKEKDSLFALLLPEYRSLFADMDELHRALWFAVNEENELMSFIVRPGETADQAIERYKIKLLAIAAALESLPCAAAEQRKISELRRMATNTRTAWPTRPITPDGEDYLSVLNRMTIDEISLHAETLYTQALEQLRSEGAI